MDGRRRKPQPRHRRLPLHDVSQKRPRTHGVGQGEDRCVHRRLCAHPASGEEVPIDRRLRAGQLRHRRHYGCPGHDTRDLEFATKFNLPIIQVVQPPQDKDWRGYVDDGVAVNSANQELSLDGLPTAEAKEKITAWLESKGLGKKTVNYKLRDWLFSRQRYWASPSRLFGTLVRTDKLINEALPESALPVLPRRWMTTSRRPTVSRFGPRSGLGESGRWLQARNQHDAPMGWQLLVLPALPRCT